MFNIYKFFDHIYCLFFFAYIYKANKKKISKNKESSLSLLCFLLNNDI